MSIAAKEIHLLHYPDGVPTTEDFAVRDSALPNPLDGEVLIENIWMSVDPYMRGRMTKRKSYIPPFELNAPLEGHAIGRVMQSRDPRFAEGSLVTSMTGWRSHALLERDYLHPIPDMPDIPPEKFLGVLGMPGMTAWVGLNRIANCKAGDTVFVSAAAGAVGSVVCQLAKAKGCRVIGSTGDTEKAKWLRTELNVDAVINYRDTDDLSGSLGEVAPQGIDVYYENVGGAHLQAAINYMNPYGRAALCGMIEQYNDKEPRPGPNNLIQIVGKSLKLEGFIVSNHLDIIPDFYAEMAKLIGSGKMKTEQTVEEGIENAPKAFLNLFSGANFGKMLVKISDDPSA